jgi:hypothetical protein
MECQMVKDGWFEFPGRGQQSPTVQARYEAGPGTVHLASRRRNTPKPPQNFNLWCARLVELAAA